MTAPVRVTPSPIDGVIEEIRVAMVRRKVTQRDLARLVSEADPWVHRRLTGKVEITVGELYRIAAALGVSPRSLLPDEVTREQPHRTFPPRRSLLPGDRPLRLSGPLRTAA